MYLRGGKLSEIGVRTAGTPHMTQGRALACGAVWEEEAPRCPRASRTPARPWDAPYTLRTHKKEGRKLVQRSSKRHLVVMPYFTGSLGKNKKRWRESGKNGRKMGALLARQTRIPEGEKVGAKVGVVA